MAERKSGKRASIINSTVLRRRLHALAGAAVLAIPAGMTLAAANIPDSFTTGTDLTVGSNWSTGAVPTVANDAIFGTGYPTAPAAFTLSAANLTAATLDDLNQNAITISNATSGATNSLITIGAGTGTNSAAGAAATDTLFIATGASLTLNGANTGGGTGTLGLALASIGSFDVAGTGSGTINANISGAFGLVKTGTGSLTLSGSNSYTGTTTFAAGNLILGSTSALSSTGTLTLNGTGTLDLGGNAQTLNNLTAGTSATAFTSVIKNGSLALGAFSETFQPSNTSGTTLLDLSRLTSFTYTQAAANQSFVVQVGPATAANTSFTLSSATNSITATNLIVGGGNTASGGLATLTLGAANTFNAGSIQLGGYRGSGGDLLFATGLTNPTLTLRGTAGGATPVFAFTDGLISSGGLATNNIFDATAGSVNAIINQLNVLLELTATPATTNSGAFRFTNGLVNAGTIDIGGTSAIAASTATTLTSTVTQNAGALLADNVIFGNNSNAQYPGSTVAGIAQPNITYASVFNLGTSTTSGILSAGTLTLGAQTSNANSRFTLNFNNGTITNYDNTANGFAGEGNADGTTNNVQNLVLKGQTGGGTAVDSKTLNIVLAATGTHTFAPEAGFSITENSTALITGTGALTINGAGSVLLNSSNTYSGGTIVSAGTLLAGSAAAFGSTSGALTINGGTLDLNANSVSVGAFSGSGGTITTGVAGTSVLTVGTGVLAGTSGAFAGNIVNGAGTLSIVKTGGGVRTLSGINTYTGGTTVNGGSIRAGSATAIPAATALTLGGGSLDLGGQYQATTTGGAGALSLSSFTFTAGGFGFTLNGGSADQVDFTSAATSSGTGILNISASAAVTPGVFTLVSDPSGGLPTFTLASSVLSAGGNSYSLSLTSSGTIDLLNVQNAAISELYFTGAQDGVYSNVNNYTSSPTGTASANTAPSSTTDVVFSANTAANLSNITVTGAQAANSLTFTGTGTAAAATPVNIGGTGSITLYANALNFTAGTGITVQAGAAADTISANLAFGGTQSETWTNSSSNVFTVSGALNNNGLGLTFAGSGAQTLSGAISGAGSLTQSGTGIVTLSGPNTFTGGVTLSSGTLALNSSGAAGTGTLTVGGGMLDNTSGGSIGLTNSSDILNADLNFVGSNGLNLGAASVSLGTSAGATRTINVIANTLEIDGPIVSGTNGTTPTVALTKTGAGTLTLAGINTYTGGTTLTAGALVINNGAAVGTGTLTLGGGATLANSSGAAETLTNNNALSLGSFVFTGTNALNLGTGAASINTSAAQTITVNGTAPLTIGGTLSTSTASNTTGTLTLAVAGDLVLSGGSAAAPSVLGTVASFTGTGSINLSGFLNTTNKTSFDGGLTINSTAVGTLVTAASDYAGIGNASLNVNGGVLNINPGTGNSLFINSGSGTGLLNVNGSTVNLTTSTRLFIGNLYNGTGGGGTGVLTVANGTFSTGTTSQAFVIGPSGTAVGSGVVNLNAGGVIATLRPITYGGSTGVGASGVFNFNGGTLLATGGSLSMTGLTAANVGTLGAIIDPSTFGVTIAQPLIHNAGVTGADGGLTKYSAGTLTLTGASTYTGPTSIQAGTLAVSGATASLGATSAVNVSTTGTFQLINTAATGPVNMLSVNTSVNLNTTSGSAPASFVELDLNGQTQTIASFVIDGALQPSGIYGSQAYFAATGQTPSASAASDEGFFGGDGAFNSTVPEPASISLIGVAAFGLLARRRRRLSK